MTPDSFDTALVCLNGHQITRGYYDYPQFNVPFCSKCGAKTIHACTECQTDIRGAYRNSMSFSSDNTPPDYCHNCGKPYPWTKDRIETAQLLIQEMDELEGDREKLTNSLPDLISDTPRTPLAAERWRKALSNLGGHAGIALRELIIEIASESAKRIMFS